MTARPAAPAPGHTPGAGAGPADQGAAARALAAQTRQHLTAAKSAAVAVATELARRALADADRIDWHAPNAHITVAQHLGAMKRHVRQLLAVIDTDGGQQ